MSIVSRFDFETQLKFFQSRARNVFEGFQSDKRNILEAAITLTNERRITLDMSELGKVILCARDLTKRSRSELNRFKDITLDRWPYEASKEKQNSDINDKNHLTTAFLSIADRYTEFKGKLELVETIGPKAAARFEEIRMGLNNL